MLYFLHQKIFLGWLIFFLISGGLATTLAALNSNQTVWGLSLANDKINGLDSQALADFLANRVNKFNRQKITIVREEKKWTLTPADFGLTIDSAAISQAALDFGHGSLVYALGQQVKALLLGQDLSLSYALNSAKFKTALLLFSALETPAKNASFKYEAAQNDFVIIPAEPGQVISRSQLVDGILKTFSQPDAAITLMIDEAPPLITEEAIGQVASQAKTLLANAPFFLQSDAASWRVDKTELAGWITAALDPSSPVAQLALDKNAISDFLSPLSASINREPLDAKLTWENNELKFAILSQGGAKLNIVASAQKISDEILASLTQPDVNKKNIYLITDLIEPKISSQNIKELGLLTLLGRGESNFSGSPANRRANIRTGATKLNGRLIKPGEEFSLAQNIGEIDAANGWLPELVIKNNQTLPEFGGGLCQVSTTLFRAAVNTGLKITERHPHAYPVHYYDPPGFDATVYPPSPDLKFLNSTPGNILLQTKIEGNKLIFEIYGTSDGRTVKIIGPTITQKNPDGSLKAILTQEIWRDGQLEQTNIFRSSYKPASLFPIATPAPTPTTPTASPTPSPSPSAN